MKDLEASAVEKEDILDIDAEFLDDQGHHVIFHVTLPFTVIPAITRKFNSSNRDRRKEAAAACRVEESAGGGTRGAAPRQLQQASGNARMRMRAAAPPQQCHCLQASGNTTEWQHHSFRHHQASTYT